MRAGRYLFSVLVLLAACGTATEPQHSAQGSKYGGVFNLNESEALRSIFPLTLTQASAFRVMSQVYQGLVAFDPRDLHIIPCLAERWEVDPTATRYTFHLRPEVRFHDDEAFSGGQGREVTADDVVRCFTTICTAGPGDQMFWLFQDRVVGANTHYAATANGRKVDAGVEGIQRVDDHTVRISLTHPSPNFLQIIAHQGCWIWPAELTEAYGDQLGTHAIGTGPFRLHDLQIGEAMVLERNPNYWGRDADGAPLPYLDAVRVTFAEDKNTEFEEFLKGRVTALLELPVDRIKDLADSVDAASGAARFHMHAKPALITQFYGFDLFHPPFDDPRVRRAFALAIDRRFLVDSVLRGMAEPAQHGLVAPGLAGYPYDIVPGIPFSPDSARGLMTAAGYPGGQGFPALQLQVNADGFGYVRVAEAVQLMLDRELGVPISISVLPANRHWERVEMGQARMWREGWTADHPDPENFLALLYGKNAVLDSTQAASTNNTRFHDAVFDGHVSRSQQMDNTSERLRALAMAEKRAMEVMPVVPLYHERAVFLVQASVRGLHVNAIEYVDLSSVWLERAERLAD